MFRLSRIHPALVFAGVFLLLLGLYWPAREAGWVSDTLGWLDAVRTQPFGDFINRRGFGVNSFYQTTQIATWSLYQLFGADRLAWHLLFIALQAFNTALLFAFFRDLLRHSGIPAANGTALLAVLLFSLSPYLTEVIVWEAAFHYLTGLAFILAQLLLLQAYVKTGRANLSFPAALLFLAATFSLELFYLTPVFSLLLLLYYRLGAPAAAPERIRNASRRFLLPQLALLAGHLLLVRLSFNASTGRLGDSLWEHPLSYFAIKPPDYVFHLFGGRFLPQSIRSAWHQFFCTVPGAALFYAALAGTLSFIAFRFRRMRAAGQLVSWAWMMTLAAIALVTPMWFPERLLVMGDRYLYLMLPFFLLIPSLLIGRIRRVAVRYGMATALLLLSTAGAFRLVALWGESEALTQKMQRAFPPFPPGTSVLLLDNPANYFGVPMSGAGADGEFALQRRLLYDARPGAQIRESFAPEYTATRQSVRMEASGGQALRISLADSQRRWWYGPDYAQTADGPGWHARMLGGASYELGFRDSITRPVMLRWDGKTYRRCVVTVPTGAY